MILAWVFFAATGTIIARYLKTEESFLTGKVVFGAKLWFRVTLIVYFYLNCVIKLYLNALYLF